MGRLGHDFSDPALLVAALSHRSWCAENGQVESNERLEFLGDSVLGMVVTDHLFREYPELNEGQLAKLRASVVSTPALAEMARKVGLGQALLLGKGEDATGGREKPSILGDAMEAVIGALFLDGGRDTAARVVLELLDERIREAAAGPGGRDFKTRLQELVAQRFEELPRYSMTDEGPDHDKRFHATVRVRGAVWGDGVGRSKKEAEQAAAEVACGLLTEGQPLGTRPARVSESRAVDHEKDRTDA
ncbi:MAG: Ribonuclease 3 [Acidimicrobiales bacterium]|nr:Ribonuclease 3 [Acidimicrobiales bacterium]